MLVKRVLYFACLLFLLFEASTCKKYPEGPLVTLRSKEQRIVGTWVVMQYLVDGVDSTDSRFPCQGYHLNFLKDDHGIGGPTIREFSWFCGPTNTGESGAWEFTDNGRTLKLREFGSPSGQAFCFGEYTEWKVLKLSNTRMHLQRAKIYDIYLGN